MQGFILGALLLLFWNGVSSKDCGPDIVSYSFISPNQREAEISVPSQGKKSRGILTVEFNTAIDHLMAEGHTVRRARENDNIFIIGASHASAWQIGDDNMFKLRLEFSFHPNTDVLPVLTRLSLPWFFCGHSPRGNMPKEDADQAGKCPIYACANSECDKIVSIEDNWNYGMKAYLNIPLNAAVNGWSMKISFDNAVDKFECWRGDVASISGDKKTVIINNMVWNKNMNSGVFKLAFIVEKTPTIDLNIVEVKFQDASCQPFKTKTISPPPARKSCPEFNCSGSECLQHSCLRHDWKVGISGVLTIPIKCEIRGWTLDVTFDSPVTRMDVWKAKVKAHKGANFLLQHMEWNRVLKHRTNLKVDFELAKSDISKVRIVKASLKPLDCKCDENLKTEAPKISDTSCPAQYCKGEDCKRFTLIDSDRQNVMKGKFVIPVLCNVDGWDMSVKLDGPYEKIELWEADLLDQSKDKTSLNITNLCDKAKLQQGSKLNFAFKVNRGKKKLNFAEITLKPKTCKCVATSAPPTVVTTKQPTTKKLTTEESTTKKQTTNAQTSTAAEKTTDVPTSIPICKAASTTKQGSTSTTTTTNAPSSTLSTTKPSECPLKKTFGKVLDYSMLFYEAQRSGKLPADNRVKWRKDSALDDAADDETKKKIDLEGGYYDAGDYVKFGFPMAAMTTVLAWGMVEFSDGYKAAGHYERGLNTIKWATDYFIKCHTEKYVFYGQVGNGAVDHAYWGRPEDMKMYRPAYKITQSKPGSELAGETAAALAAAAVAFQPTNATYANTLIKHAKELYEFADKYRGNYHNSISDAAKYYRSHSGFEDELLLAAIWLYKATGDQSYLNKAKSSYQTNIPNEYSWDNKFAALPVLLYDVTKDAKYKADAEAFCNKIIDDKSNRTPGGLAWISKWGSNRHSANVAFLCLVAAEKGMNRIKYKKFAKDQILFMLGELGSGGRSYVVGYGKDYPKQPHHASSSCPDPPATCGWPTFHGSQPNAHVLYGALVGGPDKSGYYKDKRSDYIKNEVACDYNAGFQSALAGLTKLAANGQC